MIRRKVRMASGLFDRTSPNYGRSKIRFGGGLKADSVRDGLTRKISNCFFGRSGQTTTSTARGCISAPYSMI